MGLHWVSCCCCCCLLNAEGGVDEAGVRPSTGVKHISASLVIHCLSSVVLLRKDALSS